MANRPVNIPPLPEGFIVTENPVPPLPPGFQLEEQELKSTFVGDLFPKDSPQIPDTQPSLRTAPKPTVGQKFRSYVRNIFEDKTTTNVKGQMIYQISKDTGKSLREVSHNYDKLIRDPKITGIQPDPTTKESIEAAFTGIVVAGMATHPIVTALGVTTFMALDEVENTIITGLKGGKYKFGAGRNVSEFLPEDATRTSKEAVEILDLIGKGMIVGRITPKAKAAFKKSSEFVTKQFINEYSMPREVHMNARKVKSILRGSNKDKFSPAEKDLLLDLGLSGTQYRQALKNGVAIKIPAEKITKLVDRPWWGKVKSTLRVGSQTEKIVSRERAGELSEAPRGLLTEGTPITEPIAPAKPVQPATVKPQVEPPSTPPQPVVEKPLVSTGNYQTFEAPKYVTDFLMGRNSGMIINDGGSIGYTSSKSSSAMLSKLIKQGFIERNSSDGYSLTKKGKEAKSQVAENERLEKEGVSMDHYSQKKVKKDPLMNGINVIVGKMDGEPAYTNGHYLIKGKPAPETVISDKSPPFDSVIPQSSLSDPIAKPIGWYQSSNAKVVVLSDGTKHAAVDGKYYDFIKSKFPNSDLRLTTEGKVIKVAYSKEPVDRRLNKVSIYSGGKRVGILMPMRDIITPEMLSKLTKPDPSKPHQPAVEKPKLTESETNELSSLKETLTFTFKSLSDPNATSTQLLQNQKAAIRLIKLIQDKEPEFKAPDFPFESDINEVDASSLRQVNIEATERNQHFGDTNAAKERVENIESISRADITQFMRSAFGVTIRGFATHKKPRVAGFFRPDKKTVRSKVTDDIYVLSHEVAHFLDNKIWGTQISQRPQFKQWQEELGKLDYDQDKQRTSEGFAEFVRHFVSTGRAKELAPTFHDYFTGEFARENQAIYDNLLKLRDLMTRYNKQGSVERVKSQINFDGKPPKVPIGETIKDKMLWLRKSFLDDIAFLEDIYKQEGISDIQPDKDPLQLLRAFKGKARSKAEMAIRHNTIDYVGNVTGKGLVDVLKPVSKNKKELADFMAYAYARRALSRPDIDAGIELTDAQFVFDKFDSQKFRKGSDELSAFADRVLEYYVDSGGLSPEARNSIKELNPIYMPLYRFFSDEPRFRSKGSKVSGGKPIKGLKGSGRQILNPIESMIKYVENIYASADKVRVAIAFRDMSEQNILPGGLIEKVPPPIQSMTFKTNELDKKLNKTGFGIFKIFEDESAALPDIMTMFMASKNYSGKDNIIPIYEGNEVSFYELDPRLYSMIKELDHFQIGRIGDFLFGKPTRMLKLGAVGLNATFSYIKNPIRDLVTYSIFSKNKFPNPAAPMFALAADLGLGTKAGKEAARQFKAQGGEMVTIMGRDRARYKRIVVDIENQIVGGVTGNIKNVTLHPINTLRRIFEVPELAPRIAEMQSRVKHYEGIYGKGSDAAMIAAFNDAQDVTINFSKMGEVAKYLNQLIPFFNPVIQGGEKIYREAKNNPMKVVVRGTAFITTASMYFWNQNKDKEWYQKLPPELKYSHIYIDTGEFGGSGDIVSLPLPHEMGTLFGGLPMAYWDEMYEINKDGVQEAMSLGFSQLNPGITPSVFQPFMRVASNKKWYGAPLETMSMQRKEIPDRYTDYTMPMAKVLSRWMYDNIGTYEHASPVKIEVFVNTASGGLTKNINDIITYSSKEIESKADIPVVGKLFLRKEIYENRPDFDFERLKLLRQKKASKTIQSKEISELFNLERQNKLYQRERKSR